MQWLDNLKQRIGRWYLMRSQAPRVNRHSSPYSQIHHIGILYEANRDDMEAVKKYANKLRAEGKKVFELGFYDQKELTFDHNFTLNSEFLHRQHIKWNGLPSKDAVIGFKSEPFDLLLNLYTSDCLPLFYVSFQSKAKFRLGKFEKINIEFFDMMLDVGPNPSLEELIKQIDYYIKKL